MSGRASGTESEKTTLILVISLLSINSHDRLFDSVSIVLVGKYTALQDSYTSVVKSLEHAALQCGRKLVITVSGIGNASVGKAADTSQFPQWVEASDLESEAQDERPKEFHAAWQAVCTAK